MTTTAMDRLLCALDEHGVQWRQRGEEIEFRCPAHQDREASAGAAPRSIGSAGVVIKCLAGCDTAAVLAAVGLTMRDTYDDGRERITNSDGGWRKVKSYPYVDENGATLFEVIRKERFDEDGKRRKRFVQRQPIGDGQWKWSIEGTRRVPYHLPAVIRAVAGGQVVWLVEGEKDADTLTEMGQVATCTAQGAESLDKSATELAAALTGAEVRIVADNDDAGRRYAAQAMGLLAPVAKSVSVWTCRRGKDITDHVAVGGTLSELDEMDASSLPVIKDDAPSVELPRREAVYAYTDLGNARRLFDDHGDDVRFVAGHGVWIVWDGRRWAEDITGAIVRRAMMVAETMFDREVHLCAGDDDEALDKAVKALSAWARKSQSATSIAAMIKLLAALPGVTIEPRHLDSHDWVINVANGRLDLLTGEFSPEFRRDDMITRILDVAYDPEARCERWEAFIRWAMCDDMDTVGYVQRAAGYSLTGSTREQVMFFLYGGGQNGKSTYLRVQSTILNSYSVILERDLLLEKATERHPTGIMDLEGRRMAIAQEIDEGRKLHESLVKQLTGGEPITARRMHANNVQFEVRAKLWVGVNHKPNVRGTDHAIWRRIRLIPFVNRVSEDDKDPDLFNKLMVEASGILNWMIAGLAEWREIGLGHIAAVDNATADYQFEQDHIGRFIADCCIVGPAMRSSATSLRAAYVAWCEAEGERPWSQKAVGQRLSGLDCEREHSRAGWWWRGIALADHDYDDPPVPSSRAAAWSAAGDTKDADYGMF